LHIADWIKLPLVSRRCVLGVDLGGTNVRACAYFEDGTAASEKFSAPSYAQSGLESLVESVLSVISRAAENAEGSVEAVGLAIPGHIDDAAGLVRWAPNFGHELDGVFYSWEDVPLKSVLAVRSGLSIVTGNDANLAALGEYRFGSGR
jgi:glucokinase